MEKDATFSLDREFRYSRSRIWDADKEKVLFIMLNPSTADADNDDPTIRRCIGFAKSWGFGGLYVCNLYGYRATDPNELVKRANLRMQIIGFANSDEMRRISRRCEKVVFAWGAKKIGKLHEIVVNDVCKLFPDAYYIAQSKDGHPRHPLYLKADLQLKPAG